MLAKVIIENGVKKIQALTADTGTGAPVGSIIVVCSNILPSGYLGLGVQYDITNYPALYQVLGTDTTPTASALGLPTLSSGQYAIKATSGLTENQQENVLNTINENNSYSTEEHPTGAKWIDGKPIYSKVIENPANNVPFLSDVAEVVEYRLKRTYDSENLNSFVYEDGNSSTNSVFLYLEDGNLRIIALSGGFTSIMKWVYVEYTKTV